MKLRGGVGRISFIRLHFAAFRTELSGGWTFRIQRRVNRYAQTHALFDRAGEGMETSFPSTSIPFRMPTLPSRQLRTTQAAHRFTQQRCHTCNACLATHALHVSHARPECLATHASHAVIAPCFSAQKAVYLRKSSFSVRYMSREI